MRVSPTSGSVLQSLRPFPQYSSIGQFQAPLGDSWYDALQTKVIKRFSHGLTASATYTFAKSLDSTSNNGSIYDRSSFKGLAVNDYPNMFSLSVDYTLPAIGPVKQSRIAKVILSRLENLHPRYHSKRRSAIHAHFEQLHQQLSVDRLRQASHELLACRCT